MSRVRQQVVVIGATGMLGRALVKALTSRGVGVEALRRDRLDLERQRVDSRALAAFEARAVFNASAYTDVGKAEEPRERRRVDRLNRDAPAELARACRELGLSFVHVSTDYVFDGEMRRPYDESDPVAPLQVYGASKLEGERAVGEADDRALIVRTSTLYGAGPRPRPHYVDAILSQARRGKPLSVVRAPVSSPTYAPDLAAALVDLWLASASGLVHVANAGGCSRLELATEAVRLAGLADSTPIAERPEPVGGLRRPAYSVLDTSRFASLTNRPMRPWQEGLAEYVAGAGT